MTEVRALYRLQLGPGPAAGAADPGHDPVDGSGPAAGAADPGHDPVDGSGLGFSEAAGLVGYLADLGVSHLYLSPVLTARAGSTHGYDVADPAQVAPALGGEAGLRALSDAAREAGLGVVLDIVPNHLGTGFSTPLWRTLLREGRAGAAAAVFDVDWATPLPGAADKVVLPVLGDSYGAVLHRGELGVVEEDGELRLAYHEARFPLSRETVEAVRRAGGPGELVGHPQEPDPYLRLHHALELQHYRLVHWRAGRGLVNYRRFFSIDELAGVRVEDPAVFDLTHAKILELVGDGVIDGLRVDHPDGLRDPARYLARLAERTGGCWTVVEKITHPGEPLADWPVAGTTGYEFTNDVLGLFVDPAAEGTLTELDLEMGGDPRPYGEQVEAAKREMLATELRTELRRLARQLWALLAEQPGVRDVDDLDCTAALTDVLVALDVYRAYVDPVTGAAAPEDIARVEAAVGRARRSAPAVLYPFLADLLTGRTSTDPAHLDLLARVQQLTGALTAKGVEDTVFYRYRRLLAVNEVGGDPSALGLSVGEFHARNAARPRAGLNTTATHDTKRGEDARLRIAALSELPDRWAATVRRLRVDGVHPQEQLLIFQTLVGAWPDASTTSWPSSPAPAGGPDRERVGAYVIKAVREAKQRSSWRDPDEGFEQGLLAFLDRLLGDEEALAELGEITAEAAEVAADSALAQVLLRCTSPGVPDSYQGTEGWDLNLVDPDNRRPVDFAGRRALLAALDLAAEPPPRGTAEAKLWVLSRALRARRDHPAPFAPGGDYVPLAAEGPLAGHVVAFARTAGPDAVVTVAPRLPGAVRRQGWGDSVVALPGPGPWRDLLTGAVTDQPVLRLSTALERLPVALLAPR